MKLKDGFILREVAGQTVVLSTGKELDLNTMITLNETGKFLWERMESETDEAALVAALLQGESCSLVNIGDSRAYLYSGGSLRQLTRDHSLVEDLVERGELTREQARCHPHKNLITRALGAEPLLLADCFRQPVQPGEYLLLCSDGLSNVVNEQEMLYEIIHGGDPETCCQRLLDISLGRGAPDNVTVVLVRC